MANELVPEATVHAIDPPAGACLLQWLQMVVEKALPKNIVSNKLSLISGGLEVIENSGLLNRLFL